MSNRMQHTDKRLREITAKHAGIIQEISNESDTGDGYWIYFVNGYRWENETHFIHEYTLNDVKIALRHITICTCESCIPGWENKIEREAYYQLIDLDNARKQYLIDVLDQTPRDSGAAMDSSQQRLRRAEWFQTDANSEKLSKWFVETFMSPANVEWDYGLYFMFREARYHALIGESTFDVWERE